MSDTATAGSVTDTSVPEGDKADTSAGNPEGANATRLTNGSGTEGGEWWAGLQDEGNRTLIETKGWKDKPVDDVLNAYRGLETKLGQALVPPGENAGEDEWSAFYSKLGRPEKADGYQFKLPETVPADTPYDAKSAEAFKSWAHKAGLTPSQAQVLHDEYLGHIAGQYQEATTKVAGDVEKAHDAIVKQWGVPESDTYKRNLELADRAARKLQLTDALKRRGVIGQDNTIMDADFAFALSKIGTELYAEDMLHGGPTAARNPFSDKHFDLTEAGKLVRSDPEMAKAFIRAAGKESMYPMLFPKG